MTTHSPLTERAIDTVCDGDAMLRTEWTQDGGGSRTWTTLTRLDTRVGVDVPPHLDPIPTDKFNLWASVQAKEVAA